MKNRRNRTAASAGLLFCLALSFSACRPGAPSSDSRLYRFVDLIKRENVIRSPLFGIPDFFETVTEELQGEFFPLAEAGADGRITYAAPTGFPVLGFDESRAPEGMSIEIDGEKVPFSSESTGQGTAWKWRKVSALIPALKLGNYRLEEKYSSIRPDKPLSFTRLLPGGRVEFEVTAGIGRKTFSPVKLKLLLDEQPVGIADVSSTEYRRYVFAADTKLKSSRVTLAFASSGKKEFRGLDIRIKQLRIKSGRDLILLTLPEAQSALLKAGDIRAAYISEKPKAGAVNAAGAEALIELAAAVPLPPVPDLGVPGDLPEIRKKLAVNDLSFNALLAPPPTEMRFDLDVPPGGKLEFGYGLMENGWMEWAGGAVFKVILEADGSRRELFSEVLDPINEPAHRRIFKRNLDLSLYARSKVRITFITEPLNSEAAEGHASGSHAFWVNPMLYSPLSAEAGEGSAPPNIILISLDTLRADHLGCYGYPRLTSPAIDRFAEEAVLFDFCFATSNWTLPSHVSLLTSLHGFHHQVYMADEKMSPALITAADILRSHGYICGGITGGGYVSEKFGFAKGFDFYEGEQLQFHAVNEAEMLRDHSLDWIEIHRDRPFFLFLHTYQIHDPYHNHPGTTDAFIEGEVTWQSMPLAAFLRNQSERRRYNFTDKEIADIKGLYDGEILYTDTNLIAPLMDKLRELDLYERTLIILTSDHGEEFLDHGSWLHSHTLYNELIRVPLLVKLPGPAPEKGRNPTIVRSIDILPTMLDEAGIDPGVFSLDGQSLGNVLRGRDKDHRVFMSDFSRKGVSDLRPAMVASNRDNQKFILNRKQDQPQFSLYDIWDDPAEIQNLADKNPEIVRDLFNKVLEFYDHFKPVLIQSDQVIMDGVLEERLKALGYIR